MNTQKLRHILANNLSFNVFSLAVDETRFAYRILTEADNNYRQVLLANNAVETDVEVLKTTKKLASPFCKDIKDKFFMIDDVKYVIYSEIIIDKTNSVLKRNWIPGAHFVTWFDGEKLNVENKGGITYFTLMNTADLIKHRGGFWGFDFWVRNPDDPCDKMSRSITTTPKSKIFTNVELGEEWPAEKVIVGNASMWLNLDYQLVSQDTVKPDGWAEFTFIVRDGQTGEVAEDINWSGYIIEPVDGYVPHRRLAVKKGIGTFRAMALGLRDGESMRIKIGRRFATGSAECTVKVKA